MASSSRPRALLIGPNRHDVRDGVVVRGALNLLKEAVGNTVELDYFTMEDTDRVVVDPNSLPKDTYDYLIFPATPWLWRGMSKSPKGKLALKAIDECVVSRDRVLFLGSGSSYCSEEHATNVDEVHKFFSGTNVIVRDPVAYKLLKDSNVATLNERLCPAYYAFDWVDPVGRAASGDSAIITMGLEASIFKTCLHPKDKDKYITLLQKRQQELGADVFYCELREKELVNEQFERAYLISNIDYAEQIYEHYDTIISSRVHCAVPAYVKGVRDIRLVQFDTRALTFKKPTYNEWTQQRTEYINSLQGFFSGKQ